MQNARENPLAAAAVAAAVSGGPASAHNNFENLLDIDFDGAAPASAQKSPAAGMSGLEGLAGTPQRAASPAVYNNAPTNNLDDLMGLSNGMGLSDDNRDILNGFAGLDMGGAGNQPPPPQEQLPTRGKETSEDLLGLF
jgi:AP-1 complex subunit beta-1